MRRLFIRLLISSNSRKGFHFISVFIGVFRRPFLFPAGCAGRHFAPRFGGCLWHPVHRHTQARSASPRNGVNPRDAGGYGFRWIEKTAGAVLVHETAPDSNPGFATRFEPPAVPRKTSSRYIVPAALL